MLKGLMSLQRNQNQNLSAGRPIDPAAAVCRKFLFSMICSGVCRFLPILGGFSFVLRELSTAVVAPTTCYITTCSLLLEWWGVYAGDIGVKVGCLCGPEMGCLCVDNSPESQRSVDNPQNSPQKLSEALRGWSDKEEKGCVCPTCVRGLLDETLRGGRGRNRGLRRREDQDALGRCIVQAGPRDLDLLQLP